MRSIFSSSFGRWQQRCVLMLCSNLWCWSLYRVHCSFVQALYRLSLFPSEQLRTAKSHQISLFILCVCLRRRYASCVDIYRLLTPIIIFHSSGRCIQMYTVSQKKQDIVYSYPQLARKIYADFKHSFTKLMNTKVVVKRLQNSPSVLELHCLVIYHYSLKKTMHFFDWR